MTDSVTTGPQNASVHEVRVLYADTDKMGVVYHGTYLRWFESGRATYMRRRESDYAKIERGGIQLPVVQANLSYHKPARYDDVLSVKAWVEELGRLQLQFNYEISRDDDILVRGFTRHASIDMSGKLTRLPADVREGLARTETKPGGGVD